MKNCTATPGGRVNGTELLPFRSILFMALATLTAQVAAAQTPFEVLYSFRGYGVADGAEPRGAVTISKDGALYGTTYAGGTYGKGTVFELTPATGASWNETVIYSFSGVPDGAFPIAGLTFGSGGILYGATPQGGTLSGTIFQLVPPSTAGGAWTETVLYTFDSSSLGQNRIPDGTVLVGPNGTLFTTARGSGNGTAVALTPPVTPGGSWTGAVIYTFGFAVGSFPLAGMVLEGGAFFGTDYFGVDLSCPSGGCGAVYELTPPATQGGAWTETTIHSFTGPPADGAGSAAALAVGPGGVLYGTTIWGGSGTPCYFPIGPGCGTVFQLTPPAAPGGAWTESVIHSFTGLNGDGAFPMASVVVDKNGIIYGTTQYGGSATSGSPCTFTNVSGCGTVFELMPPAAPGGAWTEKILHSFSGRHGDGSQPLAGLALSSTGVLYGTTSKGGTPGGGTVFAIKP